MIWWNHDKSYKFKFTFLGRWLARNTNAKFIVLPTCIVMVIVIWGKVYNAQLHEATCGNVYFMFCHSSEIWSQCVIWPAGGQTWPQDLNNMGRQGQSRSIARTVDLHSSWTRLMSGAEPFLPDELTFHGFLFQKISSV